MGKIAKRGYINIHEPLISKVKPCEAHSCIYNFRNWAQTTSH